MLEPLSTNKIKLFFLFLIVIISTTLIGQINYYKFENFTVKDGLAHNNVYSIYQDKEGYLWFGTQDGLCKYDGYNFTNYRSIPNKENSLATSNFGKIFQDTSGVYWFGTFGEGIDLYHPAENTFTHLMYDKDNPKSLSNDLISCIFQDSKSNIWIGTTNGGLNKYNRQENSFTRFQPDETTKGSISHNWVKCIAETSDGVIWVGTKNGLNKYNSETENFTHLLYEKENESGVSDYNIQTMVVDKDNTIWLGLVYGGLINFNPQSKEIKRYWNNADQRISKNDNSITFVYIDSDERFWLGTYDGGLHRFDSANGTFTRIYESKFEKQGLYCNRIISMHEDRSKNLWIATRGNGVWKVDLKPQKFNNLIHDPDEINSLPDANVTAVEIDKSNKLWIGTDGGGLSLYNREIDSYTHFKFDPENQNSISGNRIWSLCVDDDGVVWAGTFSSGLNRLEYKNNGWNITRYRYNPENNQSISSDQINTIKQDKNGNLWFGTADGLCKLMKAGSSNPYYFERYYQNMDDSLGYSDNYMVHMLVDSDNRIWLGSIDHGLMEFLPKSSEFKSYPPQQNKNESFAESYQVFHIYEDSKQNIWLGTELFGIIKFDKKNRSYSHPHNYYERSSNPVVGMIEDHSGNLWISTSNSLKKYNLQSGELNQFGYNDGLFGIGFNRNAVCKDQNGRLYFGSNAALTFFEPEKLKLNTIEPNVVITSISVLNEPLYKDYLVPFEYISTKGIELSWKDYFFTIEFAALDYTSTDENRYKYMLEGFDEDWIYAGDKRLASYTNLDPGTYVFKVMGSNNDKLWNEKPAELTIKVIPPFWKRTWFRILELGFIVLIIYFYVRYRTFVLVKANRNLEQKVLERTEKINQQKEELRVQAQHLAEINNNLEKQVLERTSDLEIAKNKAEESDKLKSSFLANMSHEIRTPMNAIVGFSELIKLPDLSQENRNQYSDSIIENSQSLLSLINNIIDISKLETGQLTLQKRSFDLHELMVDLFNRYRNLNTNKNITFEIKVEDVQKFAIHTDERRFYQVFDNLLCNAFKFTDKGTVEMGYKIKDHTIEFYVSDTGIGMDAEQMNLIFSRFTKIEESKEKMYRGAGLGLYISKNLIELMGGDLYADSTLGKGSVFYFNLPFNPKDRAQP